MRNIRIVTPYITLGQLLKYADLIQSGGEAKTFIDTHEILVNGVSEKQRGKKLHPGDLLTIDNKTKLMISS